MECLFSGSDDVFIFRKRRREIGQKPSSCEFMCVREAVMGPSSRTAIRRSWLPAVTKGHMQRVSKVAAAAQDSFMLKLYVE